ncbi:class I SAM-dependent methyltransferase [Candidatus Woesearchaeota archaeon]|nr:class I SAM-dependent methyltransferase [Candidatus Woesearchaeota archaeon]
MLNYLVCIYCKKKLKLTIIKSNGSEIITGKLNCYCGREYSILEGIPRILPEYIDNVKLKTTKAFAYEWKNFSKFYSEYEHQFLDWIFPVKKEFFKNKLVLDAGCGTGRHSFLSSKYGAEVIAVDLGDSVEVAYKNTKDIKTVNVIRADIYNLPFKNNTFDYIYSIGVLHHLPNPKEGFKELVKKLKKNGAISAWVYGAENNLTLKIINPFRKYLFSRFPLAINKIIACSILIFILPFIKLYSIIDKTELKSQFIKIFPQYHLFVYFSKLNLTIVHSIIFDQLLAPIAFYFKKNEFEKWFKDANLRNIKITHRNKNSWRGFGIK